MTPLELWGGVECTVNRVGDHWFDQMVWSGHDRRLDDLDRFASLGIRALRYPILWERTAPRRLDELDWRWSDERLERLRALGIRPIAGLLHHGSGPVYTSLLDQDFPIKLARFASAVARRYPWITDYTPVNEPLTTARFSGLYGHWYPHGRCDRDYVRALLNQVKGIVLAMRAIREVTTDARLVQTEDCGCTFGTRATRPQVVHEEHRRWLTWDLLTGRVDNRHPLHGFLARAGMTREDEAFFLAQPLSPSVLGLTWGLLGSYNWHSLVTRDEGHYEPGAFDVRAPAPRPTALASAMRTLAAGSAPVHPVLAARGWWRRPTRLLHIARRRSARVRDTPRLLIVGSRDILGGAFERICAERGLACHLVNEREANDMDSSSIQAVVRQNAPWGIVDAGRAMTIDDAERNAATCFRLNVTRPVTLAGMCARHDLPFVTFSSDSIFDGHQLQAERRVLDIFPSALVIRTSAPVGLATYVPDLVHAALDLLVDGEHGVWHVANEGAVTALDAFSHDTKRLAL